MIRDIKFLDILKPCYFFLKISFLVGSGGRKESFKKNGNIFNAYLVYSVIRYNTLYFLHHNKYFPQAKQTVSHDS